MKLVIDIPDGYVGVIMANQRMEGSAMDKLLRQAVIDGTPLPKGRLYKRIIRPIINYPSHNYDNISEPLEDKWYDEEYAEYLRKKHENDPRYGTFVHYSIEEKFVEIDLGAKNESRSR